MFIYLLLGTMGVIYLSMHMSMYLRKCDVTNPFIYMYISIPLCILGVVDLSIYLSIGRSIYLSICLSIYLSIYRAIELSISDSHCYVYLYIYIYIEIYIFIGQLVVGPLYSAFRIQQVCECMCM